MGAPDTIEGRFELLTLHVILIIDALREIGPEASETSQAVFDAYVRDLDGALREMGVGDLVVGKRMRELGGAFYGRAAAYRAVVADLPDSTSLEDLIRRTILAGDETGNAKALAEYVIACGQALSRQGRGLLGGAEWPEL